MSLIYEDFYNKSNIGKLVKYKVKDFGPKAKILYGRYYGRGYEGTSNYYEDDYDVITFVTPHGLLINVEQDFPEPVVDNREIDKIIKLEKKIRNPYAPFFTLLRNGEVKKSYDFTRMHLKLNHHSSKWFEYNGYLSIDSELFGKNLATLFSRMLHHDYYYNDILSKVKYTNVDWEAENYRRFMVISRNKYYNYQFEVKTVYPFIKNDNDDTPFSKNQIKLDIDDFLIYFGNTYDKKINLGTIKYGKFIPNNFTPFNSDIYRNEVIYNNIKYNFVESFIKEIMKYKIKAKKPILTQDDMDNILNNYNINRNDELQALVNLLKKIEENAKYELLSKNKVGKVLKLSKKQHK